jgi:uncharacterized protein YxjI
MEIKIQCGCGTKFKFDVEPVNGRMPVAAICPSCGANGTMDANQYIAQKLGATAYAPPAPAVASAVAAPAPTITAPPVPVSGGGLRIAGAASAVSAFLEGETPGGGVSHETGRPLLQRTTFFIKERTAMLKLTDTYDILDPASGQTIGIAKEEPPVWAKWLRLVISKSKMPTALNIYEVEGQPAVLSVHRGISWPVIGPKIIISAGGRNLGRFKKKIVSIGGGFNVFDHANQQVAEVKGNWKGWDFRFLNKSGREIGTVTKKWAGLGKELFSSADNYVIALTDLSSASADASALLLAAGLAIDVVYKENE